MFGGRILTQLMMSICGMIWGMPFPQGLRFIIEWIYPIEFMRQNGFSRNTQILRIAYS